MPTDNIPIIHDLNVIRVDVRMSALEPGLRALVEKLSQDLHVARAALATSRAVRGEYLCELNEIRHLLGAGPGVSALEAVKLLTKDANEKIAEERAESRRLRNDRDAAISMRDAARADLQEAESAYEGCSADRDAVARERDLARAALGCATTDLDQLRREIETLRYERDAARVDAGQDRSRRDLALAKERDEARRALQERDAAEHDVRETRATIAELKAEIAAIASRLGRGQETTEHAADRVVRERDAYRIRLGDMDPLVCKLANERDEARAELARYVAAVDAAIKHAAKVLP